MAYIDMLERDKGRIHDAHIRVNVMPLGSGALAGTNYPLDRSYTAKLLNFPAVTTNSLDAVSDRDFVVEVLNALSISDDASFSTQRGAGSLGRHRNFNSWNYLMGSAQGAV